jgi:purine-binding chemotaxis protein CheW
VETLIVTIAGRRFAVNMERVSEVRVHNGATRIPGAPDWLCGIVEREGCAVEVVDAALRLGTGSLDEHPHNCVVFVDVPARPRGIGMLVDGVEGIVEGGMHGSEGNDGTTIPLLDLDQIVTENG